MIDMVSKKSNPVKKVAVEKKTAPTKNIENNQSKRRKTRGSETPGKRVNNGGARKGSGRKLGAATKKTREIADKLAADGGLLPLGWMLSVLRETPDKLRRMYADGEIDTVEYTIRLQELTRRRDKAAVDACSYIHPRLSAITASVTTPAHEKFVKECEALAAELLAQEAAAKK